MVLVTICSQGANTILARYETGDRTIRTHETTRPTANPEDVEGFRRSPQTHLRFGFRSGVEAKARGFTT